MMGTKKTEANCVQYELEIAINASRERVWQAIFEKTNFWWLPNFHMVGEGSVVTFDPTPGGSGLVERLEHGGGLLWYQVQYPLANEFKIYLVGYIAPDWGGPSASHLKLALQETETGCILQVTDAQHGNVNLKSVKSLQDGWTGLFTDGLKEFVENGTRQDR
jgi:uncharacterized protein YndB with AHSA1/START domain